MCTTVKWQVKSQRGKSGPAYVMATPVCDIVTGSYLRAQPRFVLHVRKTPEGYKRISSPTRRDERKAPREPGNTALLLVVVDLEEPFPWSAWGTALLFVASQEVLGMRKDVFVSATMDIETARLLALLADNETEGNRSLLLRRAVRAAAVAHGLSPVQTPAPTLAQEGLEHERRADW
jgi:hypothetical protein